MKFDDPPDATALDPNETAGLIPDYITTQGELNELEGKNIEKALLWLHRGKKSDILNVTFALNLHKHMFGEVWKWAGKQRTSNKNIGVLMFMNPQANHRMSDFTHLFADISNMVKKF